MDCEGFDEEGYQVSCLRVVLDSLNTQHRSQNSVPFLTGKWHRFH